MRILELIINPQITKNPRRYLESKLEDYGVKNIWSGH
jgi:hypothetical protein